MRVDTGVVEGSEIQVHYDPLIAKVRSMFSRIDCSSGLTSAAADYMGRES